MTYKPILLLLTPILILTFFSPSLAEVQFRLLDSKTLDAAPIDMAVSTNGRWLFVLTNEGEVVIFSSDDQRMETIKVGKHLDRIEVGATEETLFLMSRKAKKVVTISLDFTKRINVVGAPFKGPADAPVEIVLFTDFNCQGCSEIAPLLDRIMDKYPQKVKIIFKSFPPRRDQFAIKLAKAAFAAQKQGMFWDFHDLLFEKFDQLNDARILEIPRALGLNEKEFKKDMNDPKTFEHVMEDIDNGFRAGVRGTPTFFVNGWLQRNQSVRGIEMLIEKELKKQADAP